MSKNFFVPSYFNPRAAKVFASYCKGNSSNDNNNNVVLEMYLDNAEKKVEYRTNPPLFMLFLPNTILQNHHFGKINSEQKKLILRIALTEDNFTRLIEKIGGTCKKIRKQPTLGDLLNQK